MIMSEIFHDRFYLGASATAAVEFCDCDQFDIDVYTPHQKYQVKPL